MYGNVSFREFLHCDERVFSVRVSQKKTGKAANISIGKTEQLRDPFLKLITRYDTIKYQNEFHKNRTSRATPPDLIPYKTGRLFAGADSDISNSFGTRSSATEIYVCILKFAETTGNKIRTVSADRRMKIVYEPNSWRSMRAKTLYSAYNIYAARARNGRHSFFPFRVRCTTPPHNRILILNNELICLFLRVTKA